MLDSQCIAGIIFLAAAGTSASVQATDASTLVENRGCVACHAMQEARIGPPYVAIAARYAGKDDQTIELLAQKIMRGGAGNWGVVPMIPHDSLDSQQAADIVRWILLQRAEQGS